MYALMLCQIKGKFHAAEHNGPTEKTPAGALVSHDPEGSCDTNGH